MAQQSDLVGLTEGDGITYGTWDRRPRVTRLQSKLNEHGAALKLDGMFGPNTLRALNAFQALHGISQGNVVDRATADALEGSGRGSAPQCPPGYLPIFAEA